MCNDCCSVKPDEYLHDLPLSISLHRPMLCMSVDRVVKYSHLCNYIGNYQVYWCIFVSKPDQLYTDIHRCPCSWRQKKISTMKTHIFDFVLNNQTVISFTYLCLFSCKTKPVLQAQASLPSWVLTHNCSHFAFFSHFFACHISQIEKILDFHESPYICKSYIVSKCLPLDNLPHLHLLPKKKLPFIYY